MWVARPVFRDWCRESLKIGARRNKRLITVGFAGSLVVSSQNMEVAGKDKLQPKIRLPVWKREEEGETRRDASPLVRDFGCGLVEEITFFCRS